MRCINNAMFNFKMAPDSNSIANMRVTGGGGIYERSWRFSVFLLLAVLLFDPEDEDSKIGIDPW
jgi:hypothetical protein